MKDDSVRDKAMEKLVERGLRAGLKPASSSCLDAEIMAAYVEHALSPRERANCEGHLVSCARCQEHVAALVRLSESDEPAQVRVAAAPARALRPSWFRMAFAGPVLAAVLVGGIYFMGPFRDVIKEPPETSHPVQHPSTPPPPPPQNYDQDKGEPNSAAKRTQVASGDKKASDDNSQPLKLVEKKATTQPPTTPTRSEGGTPASITTTVGRNTQPAPPSPQQTSSSLTDAQSMPRNLPKPEPTTTERGSPVRSQEIATPSVRAKIAQAGPGENGEAGGGKGMETSIGGTGGRAAGGLANNLYRKNSKDEDKVRPAQRQGDATGTIAKEEADVAKAKTQNEAIAKTDSRTTTPPSTEPRDREQRKQEVTPSVEISAASHSGKTELVVSSPIWRVGRHGLIAQRDQNGNWKKHKSGVKADLNEISFASPEVGWAVGQAGSILRSTDGGKVWIQVPSPSNEDIVHVTAISEWAASIVTRSGDTLNTADGGKTWSPKSQ